MNNFIGISREIVDHWIYKDSDSFKVWFEILVRARFSKEPKTDTYKGILYTINYGEFIYGRPAWSKRLNIGEQKLRGIINKLIKDNMIVIKKLMPSSTIAQVVNYAKYNHLLNQLETLDTATLQDDCNQQNNQRSTSTQPALNQHSTTKEECKEGEERKKEKNVCIYTIFQPPLIEDVKKYCLERNKGVDPDKWIDHYTANGWMVGKVKMKDWKAAVRTWEKDNKKWEEI